MAQIDASIPLRVNTAEDYQKQTMNQMALEDMQLQREQSRQAMQNQKALREAMAGADTSTPEGQADLLKKVGAIDPSYRIKLEKDFSDSAKSKAEIGKYIAETDHARIQTALEKTEIFGREASAVKDAYQSARSAGRPEAEALKIANDAHIKGLANLLQNGVINSDQFKQMVAQPFDVNKVDGAISQAMSVKEKLQQQLEASKQKETERHNKVEESQGAARIAIQREEMQGAKLSPDAENQAAEIYLKTGQLPPNLGRGKQGSETIARIVNKAAQLSGGKSTDQIIEERQENKASGKTRLELGSREGKIAPRVEEAKQFAGIALKASDTVDRSVFRSFNKFMQMGEGEIGDPKLRAFQAANTSLVNAYAAAVSGGSPTVSDKEHARELLSTADSPEAYKAVVNQMITEANAALKAPKTVMEGMRSEKSDSKVIHWDDLK